jgi:hypothetical protein
MTAPLSDRPDPIGALARLDQRVVPVVQRGARAVVQGLGCPFRLLRRLEDRYAGRLVHGGTGTWRAIALTAAVVATVGSALHLQRFPDIRDARATAAADAPQRVGVPGGAAERGAGGAAPAAGVVVGPPVGAEVGAYVAERRDALAALPDGATRLAVVSFDDYRAPDQVAAALPEAVVAHLVQYRLPAEGEPPLETEVVAGDVTGSVSRAVEAAVQPVLAEIDELRGLLASDTVDDPAYEAEYERRLSELQAVRNLLDAGQRVVFAVVVEGPAGALRDLAGQPGVRLVDLADGDARPNDAAFYGLLPEDRDQATFGDTA